MGQPSTFHTDVDAVVAGNIQLYDSTGNPIRASGGHELVTVLYDGFGNLVGGMGAFGLRIHADVGGVVDGRQWAYLAPATPQAVSALHAVNTITLAAGAAGIRNILTMVGCLVRGTGTAPSQASPVLFTVKDGTTVIYTWSISALTNIPFPPLGPGIAGSPATAMVISVADPGPNNSTDLNIASYTG